MEPVAAAVCAGPAVALEMGMKGGWQCITEHTGKAAGEILRVKGCDMSLFSCHISVP